MSLPRRLWALALTAASVTAFKDTSPYIEISSIPSSPPIFDGSIVRAKDVQSSLQGRLRACQHATYLLVTQPSVSINDFSTEANSAPFLQQLANNATGAAQTSSVVYPDVLGRLNEEEITQSLVQHCGATFEDIGDGSAGYSTQASVASPHILRLEFPHPDTLQPDRKSQLQAHDSFLGAVAGTVSSPYLILYITTPPSESSTQHENLHLYNNEDPFNQGLHVDLKRDFGERQARNASLPLFETYQFFNPAIFTAILVSITLFLMLYVGVSAVAGLEVSYFAFSKEMGPAAQKKQQ